MSRFPKHITPYLIISFAVGVSGGVLLNLFLPSNGFTLEKNISFEIDPIGIVGLFVTLYIVYVLERTIRNSERVNEGLRTALVNKLNVFESDFLDKIKELATGGKDIDYINSVLKRHRMRINEIVKLAQKHSLISKDSQNAKNTMSVFKEIQDLMTDSESEYKDEITVVANIVSYSERRTDKIVQKLFVLNSKLFDLFSEINSD